MHAIWVKVVISIVTDNHITLDPQRTIAQDNVRKELDQIETAAII